MSLITHKLGVMSTHLLEAWLIKTTKRLTFQINYQAPEVTNTDVTAIKQFTATNGYDVISEHRMDIQSRRIWLLGAESDQPAIRSGTMATPVQSLCDEGFTGTIEALHQWATHNNGYVTLHTVDAYTTINEPIITIAPKPQECCSYWRNDAIENAAIIADKYEQGYCAQDIRNMKRPNTCVLQQSPAVAVPVGEIDFHIELGCIKLLLQQSGHFAEAKIADQTLDYIIALRREFDALKIIVNCDSQSPRITEQDDTDNADVYATLYLEAKHWFLPHIESGELPPSVIDSVQHLFEHWLATKDGRVTEQDARAMADWILENHTDYDTSGSRSHDGRIFCLDCGVYECNGEIKHTGKCMVNKCRALLNKVNDKPESVGG